MEKDISVIVDVEPEEAKLLVGLVERLIKDWYIARNEREKHLAELKTLGAQKKAAKKVPPSPP